MTSPIHDKEPDVSLALVRAASSGDLDAVKSLLANGADVNGANESGQTPLILAAVMGHAEIVAHLISAGADPQLRDRLDLTALEWSTRRGFADVSQFLSKVSPSLRKPQAERKTDAKETHGDRPSSSRVTTDAEPVNPVEAAATETTTTNSEKEGQAKLPTLAPQPEVVGTSISETPFEPAAVITESATPLPSVDEFSPVAANEPESLRPSAESETDSATPLPSVAHSPTVGTYEPELQLASAESETDSATPLASVAHSRLVANESQSLPPSTELPPASAIKPAAEISDPVVTTIATPTLQSPDPEAAVMSSTQPVPLHEEDETLSRRGVPASVFDVELPEPWPAAMSEDPAPAIQIPKTQRAAAFSGSTPGLSNTKIEKQKADVPKLKRCPRCGAVYQNSPLSFCTRDNATLIDVNELHQFAAPAQTSATPIAVWVLIAFVLGASGFAAYRLTERFYRQPEPAPAEIKPIEAPPVPKKPAFSVGGDLAGSELNIPEPEYPSDLITAGINGPITVRIRVNENGRVISATSSDGDSRLRAAAVKAARLATFAPDKLAQTSRRGRAVAGSITYDFAAPETNAATSPATTSTSSTTTPGASTASSGAATPNPDPGAPVVSNELSGAASNVPTADYPARAKRAGIGGAITVTVRVNRAGRVVSWRSSAGDSQLRAAAIRAARRAAFSRDKLPGNGDVVGTITYNFTP